MSDITRSEAIKTLKEHLSHWERLHQEHICEDQEGIDTISALKLAIASLETDEAYNLMYEQPEFCVDCISRKRAIISITACDGKSAQIEALKKLPSVYPENTVSLSAYKQVAWERDIAIEQLKELGYEFGQKIEPTTENDLVSSIVEKISEKVTETREEFIFETIRPYCENVVQMKISKRDLEQALLKYYGKNNLGVDTVSRADARSLICNTDLKYHLSGMSRKVFKDLYNGIDELPPITPQEPRWIPVSERLPKIADVYRVTRYYKNNVIDSSYHVDACFFDGSNTWYNDNRINHERAYANNVIAWQENPEPYKVEPQESEVKE